MTRRPPSHRVLGTGPGGLGPTLGFPGSFPVLAQTDLEEYQEHGRAEPDRYQHERQQLSDQSRDEDGAQDSGDHQDPG
jgi:hypothetical protein